MFGALQRTDPRCPGSEHVSAEDQAQLKQLAEVVKTLKKDDGSNQRTSEDANKAKAEDNEVGSALAVAGAGAIDAQ